MFDFCMYRYIVLSLYSFSDLFLCKGLSIKDVRSHWGEEGGLSSAEKGGGRIFRSGHPHFFAQKLLFIEIYNVSARKGRRINFPRFCADIFYGRPLTSFYLVFFKPRIKITSTITKENLFLLFTYLSFIAVLEDKSLDNCWMSESKIGCSNGHGVTPNTADGSTVSQTYITKFRSFAINA